MITLRFPDAWNWIRAGMLDVADDGRMGRSIAEVEIDGERHVLTDLHADLEVGLGLVTLTYESASSDPRPAFKPGTDAL
jgi:hypothetical protein